MDHFTYFVHFKRIKKQNEKDRCKKWLVTRNMVVCAMCASRYTDRDTIVSQNGPNTKFWKWPVIRILTTFYLDLLILTVDFSCFDKNASQRCTRKRIYKRLLLLPLFTQPKQFCVRKQSFFWLWPPKREKPNSFTEIKLEVKCISLREKKMRKAENWPKILQIDRDSLDTAYFIVRACHFAPIDQVSVVFVLVKLCISSYRCHLIATLMQFRRTNIISIFGRKFDWHRHFQFNTVWLKGCCRNIHLVYFCIGDFNDCKDDRTTFNILSMACNINHMHPE